MKVRSYYTGQPSPMHQTARRVSGTAAGYTEGAATPDGARLFYCERTMRAVVTPTQKRRSARAEVVLEILQSSRGDLPPLAEIGRAIGKADEHATTNAVEALRTLQRRGQIVWWRGVDHGHPGHHVIRIVETGLMRRTPGCPWP